LVSPVRHFGIEVSVSSELNPHLNFGAPALGIEYRRSPRYRILQRCQVRIAGASPAEACRCIAFSISQTGVGVTLPVALEKGVELTIEAWNLPKAQPLQARIVHTNRLEFVWLCGCEFVKPIAKEELAEWLPTAAAGLYSNE